jgi:hypothetical protein
MEELPQRAATEPERVNVREVDASGTSYGLDEAADRYGLSVSTLRRRLAAGEVQGAHKVPGPKGVTWRIPGAALAALGYETVDAHPVPAASASAVDVGRLVDVLEDALANANRQLEAGEDERRRQVEERTETERRAHAAEIEAARMGERVAALERELAAARKRWWRRRSTR